MVDLLYLRYFDPQRRDRFDSVLRCFPYERLDPNLLHDRKEYSARLSNDFEA